LTILRAALDDETTRDRSAKLLSELVIGLPATAKLNEMKALLDRFRGKFRRATRAVWNTEAAWGGARFEPAIVPLDRPATAEDVEAGRAVFHLSGKGKRTALSLPAVGIPRTDPGRVNPLPVLIVQAETGPDGVVIYGIVERHAIRSAPASQFARVTPLKELKEDDRDGAR
jgi:hypothetical protein